MSFKLMLYMSTHAYQPLIFNYMYIVDYIFDILFPYLPWMFTFHINIP